MSTQNVNFENKEGQKVPSVTFPMRINDDWAKRDTQEIFAGKTVVVFFHYLVLLHQRVLQRTYRDIMS